LRGQCFFLCLPSFSLYSSLFFLVNIITCGCTFVHLPDGPTSIWKFRWNIYLPARCRDRYAYACMSLSGKIRYVHV
jgi:hypothetical protein